MTLHYTAHVPAGDGPFPTLLALHGWGASAHDLIGLAPMLHDGNALVLCPQGPVTVPIQPGYDGFGWFPLSGGKDPDPAQVAEARELVLEFLATAIARYPVDDRKLAILGFSQGGFMAFELALREPERFCGLLGLSTWLPEPLAATTDARPEFANLPALILHGTEDPMIPVARGRDSRDALLGLGLPTTYREYEMGHEIQPEALGELVRWLDEKAFSPVLPA